MPSSYWYYGLVAVSLILLGAAFWYRRDWKLLILHLSVSALIRPFEIFVLSTHGYRFMPGIALTNSMDNYLGAYVSDLFIVPATAVAISAFLLSWRAVLLIAAIFTGIDWSFTMLGIYEHYWWKSIYTGIGLFILFTISGWLWRGLKTKRPKRLFQLFIIYLCYTTILGAFNFAVNGTGNLYKMLFWSWNFADQTTMHVIISNVYQVVVAVVVVLCIGLKISFYKRISGIVIIILLDWAIGYFGIFVPQVNITSHLLILFPIVVVPMMIALFKIAKLDYLFP